MSGLTIAQMRLAPVARRAAELLQAACPYVIFTSGRRDLESQAVAMAENTIQNRHWIAQTYLHAAPLQQWIMDHPEAETAEAVADGLYTVLLSMSDAEVSQISRHLTGDAFDVQPMLNRAGAKILEVMQGLPGKDKVLTREGGLIRWHIQFKPSVEGSVKI